MMSPASWILLAIVSVPMFFFVRWVATRDFRWITLSYPLRVLILEDRLEGAHESYKSYGLSDELLFTSAGRLNAYIILQGLEQWDNDPDKVAWHLNVPEELVLVITELLAKHNLLNYLKEEKP